MASIRLPSFALTTRALSETNVRGIYVDTGLMRKNETEDIMRDFEDMGMHNVSVIDAHEKFLTPLRHEFDAEEKESNYRKSIF